MKFDEAHAPRATRELRHYRTIRVQGLIGFEIEATDQWPDDPHLWFERDHAILHHHGHVFFILPNIPNDIMEELKQTGYVVIDEKHQRRLSDSPSPFGIQPQGTARLYEVPIIQVESDHHIKTAFQNAENIGQTSSEIHSLSSIFSA